MFSQPAGRAAAGAVMAALLLVGCGGDDSTQTKAAPPLPTGCKRVAKPPPKRVDLKPPKRELAPRSKVSATVKTSCGSFTIALDVRQSPQTASSFVYLAHHGVYDRTWFHKIVPGFVIQGGDPRGNGSGGPGYFVDEPPPARTRYVQGTVAMAKGQVEPPGRSGSQFFVVTGADAGLSPAYAVLGHVTGGMDVVDRIEKLGDRTSGGVGTPLAPVVIESVSITRR